MSISFQIILLNLKKISVRPKIKCWLVWKLDLKN